MITVRDNDNSILPDRDRMYGGYDKAHSWALSTSKQSEGCRKTISRQIQRIPKIELQFQLQSNDLLASGV